MDFLSRIAKCAGLAGVKSDRLLAQKLAGAIEDGDVDET